MSVKTLESIINKGVLKHFSVLTKLVTILIQNCKIVNNSSFVTAEKLQKVAKIQPDLQTLSGIIFVTRFCYIYKVTDFQIISAH